MDDFAFYLAWLGFFASILLGWYFYLQARTKERMALIEKNVDLSEINKVRELGFRFSWLKLGMMLMGVGFGFCLSLYLMLKPELQNLNQGIQELMVLGCMLFFGGLALVISHFIEKPKAH